MSTTTGTPVTKLPSPPMRDTSALLIKCGAFVATAFVAGGLWAMMS